MNDDFIYTGHAELDQQQAMPGYNRHIARLFTAAMKPGQVLLDFGAGIGTISTIVRDMARPSKIICAELDAQNIAALRSKNFEVLADIGTCPAESVDVVYSSNVLEHIEDDVAALKTLYAALKPGGRAVFWVPAFNFLWTAMDDRVEHYRRYSRITLESTFDQAGFKIEKSMYQDSVGFFVTLLYKLIGRKDGTVNTAMLEIYDSYIFPVSKICDFLFSGLFGKNVVIYASKD